MAGLLVIRNADVHAPEPLGRRDLLIGGGRVLAIEERIDGVERLPGVTSLDVEGRRVVPGFVDTHVHLTGGGGESGPASRVPRLPFDALVSAGVTTAIGVLGTDCTTRSVESLVSAVQAVREQGLSAWCWTGGYEVPPITLTGNVRKDIVYVDPIIGVGEVAISDHRSSQPTFDEIARLAADCHVAGMMSGKAGLLHLHLGDGPRGLSLVRRVLDETELPPSTFYPTHVNRRTALFKEGLEIAGRGCPIDVTAFPVEEGEDAYDAAEAITRYLDSKAPRHLITCSSDGGGCLPKFDASGRLTAMDVGRPAVLFETFATLLSRGAAIADVLPVFTKNPADILRLGQKGRIAVGADADLVSLDEKHHPRDVIALGRKNI
jgi:beta-aspartyl-dipeptidase (metallo-type)